MIGNISKSKGFKGDKGEKGDAFKYTDFTSEQLEGLKVKGDTPLITFSLDADGNLYYSSDGILVDKEYADSNNFATKQFVMDLVNKAAPSPASITLYADRWQQVENESMWYQIVVVANATITEYSKIDLQPSPEQLCVFHEKDLAFVTENEDGIVTVFCIGQKPTNNYTIQATVMEVTIND